MIHSGKNKKTNLYFKFRKLGFKLNLVFTNCGLFGDIFMGLDLKSRKLVIADGGINVSLRHTIELADLRGIAVKKVYKSIRAGELNVRNMADFILSIHIRLEFQDGKAAIVLAVCENNGVQIKNIQKVERQLAKWYSMLSRLISHSPGRLAEIAS